MLTLFFTDQISNGATQDLENEEAHHAIKVLRLNIGEEIKISDGIMSWVSGPIVEISKKNLKISISGRGKYQEIMPELVLVQAITKSDRNKEMLELAVSAGVNRIIPWQSQRSISQWKDHSELKWQVGIKEACKQARQVRIPKLMPIASTNQIAQLLTGDSIGVVFHESASEKISDLLLPKSVALIYLIIGPEGGISESEISIFKNSGGKVVKLGETVLRSAHAGFAAIAAIQTKLGRW